MKIDHAEKGQKKKNPQKKTFRMQNKEKKMPTLHLGFFRARCSFFNPPPHPRPSFLFWSWGLGSRASPGNNQNNFQLGRKEMEFQMKDEQGGFDGKASGTRARPRHPFPFHPQTLSTLRWRAGRQLLPSFSPAGGRGSLATRRARAL